MRKFIYLLGIGLIIIFFWALTKDSNTEIDLVEEDPIINQDFEYLPIELTTSTFSIEDGELSLQLADAFAIATAAEDLGKARFMAMSPDGRIFVPDLVNYNLSHEGRVLILGDFNEESHKFESQSTYLSDLRGPNSIAFYKDQEGKDWLYLALTKHLLRYPYEAGDMAPSGEPEIIRTFADWQSPGAASVVWHITRTLLFHEDTLYVSVGSGCNACEQPLEEMRGAILTMDPDGENARIYADGLRNAVGLEWSKDSLYATDNGSDHLGLEAPDDLMYKIEEGKHYSWPYCYESEGIKKEDNTRNWQRKESSCEEAPMSFAAFDPHSAPLGITFWGGDSHPLLKNSFLVSLHGSFEPEIANGYKVLRVSEEGEKEVFMEGFLLENGERIGRPVHVLKKDENSFFLTDDHSGRIYYIYAL